MEGFRFRQSDRDLRAEVLAADLRPNPFPRQNQPRLAAIKYSCSWGFALQEHAGNTPMLHIFVVS